METKRMAKKKSRIPLKNVCALVFDFDGVLTDNRVWVDSTGKETVACHRGDGLGFKVLRNLKIPCYILSAETNPVVSARAKKLKIEAFQNVQNKKQGLIRLAGDKKWDLAQVLYVGNDLNDYEAMRLCGYSACPSDSHAKIKKIATHPLKTRGGFGVAREIIESIL